MINAYIGDLHGQIGVYDIIKTKFEEGKFDKIIFMGDYVDSFNIQDEYIIELVEDLIKLKTENMDKVFLLWGNHDVQYLYMPGFRCSGFRISYATKLKELFKDNLELFQIAHQEGNILATHAGVTNMWYHLYEKYIKNWANFPKTKLDPIKDIAQVLNMISLTHDDWILHSIGTKRGGVTTGGPLWADMSEIRKYGLISQYHHIVGHNQVERVETYDLRSDSGKMSKVTFVDCLHVNIQYHKVNI